MVKTLRYELDVLRRNGAAIPSAWPPSSTRTSLMQTEGAKERATALAARRIAQSGPVWTVLESDPQGQTVFFLDSEALVDSEWGFGIRIPEAEVDRHPVAVAIKKYSTEVLAFIDPFAKAFQDLGREAAKEASERSDAFIKKVFNRQFPWESGLNSRFAPGTLTAPPQHQFILAHPHAGLIVSSQGKVTATPSILFEVFGWERLTSAFDASWGLSAAYAPRLNANERDGPGVLFRIQSQAVGVVWKADEGQGRTAHLVYSVALGRWLAKAR